MKMTLLMLLLLFMIMMTFITQKLVVMGSMLIASAAMTTLLTTLVTNSWYGFMLFIIYITGLLVLFGYFLALSPNTYLTTKKCFKSYFFIMPYFLIPSIKFIKLPTFKMNFEFTAISLIMNKNMNIYWLMTIILLIALIMVVSITYKTPSPLRKYVT